ncbi:MAG: helix-turn-helix domain-containing protein [Anaerolineales bacterium]|nr:helix-turn-helix domain-containing protein [Anaerolineales bacterium]
MDQNSKSGQGSKRVLAIDLSETSGDEDTEQVLKTLASDRRLEILRYLGGNSCSVNEIAEALDMPPSTATMHINMLEKSGLIRTELKPASRGLQKICARAYDRVLIVLPSGERPVENSVDISMPVGAFVDCQVAPTCGLAGEQGVIGHFDDPSSFYDPDRVYAQLLWFKQGYVEYRFPNRLPAGVILESVQVSLELCSEAPLHNDDWPSDVTMWVNDVEIGTWTSPADFGGERGALTPGWWEEWNSQYGLLKVWRVTRGGTYVDGMRASDVTLDTLGIRHRDFIAVRIGIKEGAANAGGLNIFGRRFGNYPQDIVMRLNYLASNSTTNRLSEQG